jgi:aspartate aminotransferase
MINKKMYALGNSRSVIRELFEYGKTLKAQVGEDKVYDFTLGNPSVECPKIINDTLIDIIKNDKTVHQYTSAQGDLLTRKKIVETIFNTYGFSLDENLLYLTCGAAASLRIIFQSIICNSTDEVLAFAPFFPEYRVFVEASNGTFKYVPCDEKDFLIDFNAFENLINVNTKAVIINSPNNPSGVVYDEQTITKLAEILNKKQKEFNHPIYLVTDEPYREIVFDNSLCPFIPKYYNNTIVCYSYSKSLSMPGERIGYVAVSPLAEYKEDLYKAIMGSGRALGYVCAPSLFQKVIAKHVDKVSTILPYKDNRDILMEILNSLNFKCVNPKGAFYLFIKSPIPDANAFSESAKK